MENQKLEEYYSERSSTIFSEMLGEDENYRRLKKAKIAAEKAFRASSAKIHGSNTSPWMKYATSWNAPGTKRCIWLVLPITKKYPKMISMPPMCGIFFL